MPGKRKAPRLPLIVGGLVAVLTVVTTLQMVVAGFVFGTDSPVFALRLWASCLIWLGLTGLALVLTPLVAPGRRVLLQRIWVGALAITAAALGSLGWLAASGRVETSLLVVGVAMALAGWVGTFLVPRLGVRGGIRAR